MEIDPPSTISDACQYVEIRGQNPGGIVPANTYFLSVNSDAGNFGFANQAINIGGQVVGSNGTITMINVFAGQSCAGRVFDPGTTIVTYNSSSFIGGGGFQTSGSEGFLLVQSTGLLNAGSDLDVDDDGLFDAAFGITIIDGFAFLVNPDEEYVYGAEVGVVNISNPGDQPDAATRFPGNNTPLVDGVNAFYYGELAASPDNTTVYAAPLSGNFPVGGALTPGAPNAP